MPEFAKPKYEQSHAPKSTTVLYFNGDLTSVDSVMWVVRASHRISSYSYSAKRYSVKRYSYSMAVGTAAMPIVDRGGLRETADLWAGLLY
jgi:hypothetical protein